MRWSWDVFRRANVTSITLGQRFSRDAQKNGRVEGPAIRMDPGCAGMIALFERAQL